MTEITFELVSPVILGTEGGYVNDSGGPTNHGITVPILAEFLGRKVSSQEIKDLTQDKAKEIFKQLFWDKQQISELPNASRAIVMDMSVNQGRHGAGVLLQEVVGAYPDGDIGPHTIRASKNFSGDIAQELTVNRLLDYAKDSKFKLYAHSWFSRSTLMLQKTVEWLNQST